MKSYCTSNFCVQDNFIIIPLNTIFLFIYSFLLKIKPSAHISFKAGHFNFIQVWSIHHCTGTVLYSVSIAPLTCLPASCPILGDTSWPSLSAGCSSHFLLQPSCSHGCAWMNYSKRKSPSWVEGWGSKEASVLLGPIPGWRCLPVSHTGPSTLKRRMTCLQLFSGDLRPTCRSPDLTIFRPSYRAMILGCSPRVSQTTTAAWSSRTNESPWVSNLGQDVMSGVDELSNFDFLICSMG